MYVRPLSRVSLSLTPSFEKLARADRMPSLFLQTYTRLSHTLISRACTLTVRSSPCPPQDVFSRAVRRNPRLTLRQRRVGERWQQRLRLAHWHCPARMLRERHGWRGMLRILLPQRLHTAGCWNLRTGCLGPFFVFDAPSALAKDLHSARVPRKPRELSNRR